MITYQTVSVGTKEGKAFLRKVARFNIKATTAEEWHMRASDATAWQAEFRRTIKGSVGEPDQEIVVLTDAKITPPRDRDIGTHKPFADAQEVLVIAPMSVCLNGDTGNVARLLADGYTLRVSASAGSTNSSRYGLSFYHLEAYHRDLGYYGLQVGGTTVAVEGRTVVSGPVNIGTY